MDTVEEYLDSLPEPARAWVSEFVDGTAAHYPSVPLIMFRQRPMFKFGRTYQQGYVMFTAAKAHFAVHSVEFDLIEAMQVRLPKAGFGKGSVKVRFADEAAKPVLYDYVAQVMARHGIPRV
jgi:uncharacterized protein YdhG (YjbR/CyaY superfamily)